MQIVFQNHQVNGVVNIWDIRKLMAEVGIQATDEELFLILPEADANKDQKLTLHEFVALVQKYKSSGQSSDQDGDLLYAWIQMGGSADKTGKITLTNLQQFADSYGYLININQIMKQQMERKNAQKISQQNNKVSIPDVIDFEQFMQILSQDSTNSSLPSWIMEC